ncbi:hypothetical protein [Vibrio superstes]|uniref:Uncharacterized protein n=1 Tax=Vibrio superstes NBRC 103154 TaxID=1219062 RepID=A0A511QSJ2_9VIBR|nr:hypothetical protein [Vibrio superstes]GEM80323.1 hypothetical protein VSU01S_25680 [Vibrio superstes NBRC 103154]
MLSLFLTKLITGWVAIDPRGLTPVYFAQVHSLGASHYKQLAIKSGLIIVSTLLAFLTGIVVISNVNAIPALVAQIIVGVALFLTCVALISKKKTHKRIKKEHWVGNGLYQRETSARTVYPLASPYAMFSL